MSILVFVTEIEVALFLTSMLLVVSCRMTSGRIEIRGLIWSKSGTRRIDPIRVQLLASTIATSLLYLLEVLHEPSVLPQLRPEILYFFGGSNLVYVMKKFSERN